ncbi:MAG TPA: hypothetical protein DCX54_08945, partial [Flavobacteriales bacterium]|nr:hypothetical protein [Flavobacteriales bacterium]
MRIGNSALDKLNQEAWVENRKNPELAISKAKKVLIESKKTKYQKGKAAAIHTIGAAYGWLSDFEKASEYLGQALSLFTDIEELNGVADTSYSIGVVDYLTGNFKKAKTNFHKCLDIYLSTENLEGETNAYNGLGSVYTEIGAYEDAWDYLNRGLKISESTKETLIRPKILDGLATICNLKGDHEKAILFFKKSRKLNKNLNNQNQESYNLHGIGESYMRMKQYDKAKSHFEECIAIRKSLGFKVGEAQSEQRLGSVYFELKEYDHAEKHLFYALELAHKINGKNIEMLASESLAKLYEKRKEYKKFAEHLKNYYELKSVLFSEEKEKQQSFDLEKANLNTKVLSEIGQEIISSLELEKVLFTVYQKVNKLMDASVFGLGLYIPKEELIEYKLVIDRGKRLEPYTRDMKDKSQLAVWTIENKRTIFINDVEKDKSKYGEAFSSEKEIELHKKHQTKISNVEQSYIYIPIMNGEDVIGVITVQSFEKNAYSQDHLDILKNIAVYASIGVINSRMYEALEQKIELSEKFDEQHKELEQSYENTRVLNEIGQRITMSITINEVVKKVYNSINDLMDATVFSIGIYNKEKKTIEFKGAIEKGKELPNFSYSVKDENRPGSYCFTKKKEVLINDWKKDIKKYVKKDLPAAAGELPESLIYIPLISKGNAVGVLSVQSFKKNAYTKHQVDTLRTLSVYISSALENALLYESMEEKVKERTHEIEQSYKSTKVLGEIGMDIISTLELDKVLFTIYEKTNKLMDATIFGIGILNSEKETIEYRLAIDRGTKYEPYSRDAKDKSQFAVWCIDNKKPVFMNDIEKEKYNYLEKHKSDKEIGIMKPTEDEEQSLMYVPLLSAEKVIGVISVQSYR